MPTKTLFLILAPRPLSTRLGAFSSPETFSHKFFPKFFPIRPRRLFSVFLVRKIMRVEGACRSANGGGWSLFAGSPYSRTPFCPLCLHLLPALSLPSGCSRVRLPSIVADFQPNRAKQGKNEFFFGVLWCFLGKIGDRRGRNLNIFLKSRKENSCGGGRLACLLACPLVAGGRGTLAMLLTVAK